MSLAIRRTGADEYGNYIKALICGEPGTGKTLTSSTWPNPLYASAEGGLMSVADRHLPYAEIRSSDQLLRLKNALDQEASVRAQLLKVPVDTIIVDTIDEIQRILIRERLDTQKKEHMAVQDFGWLGDQMRAIIRGFRNLPMHVVFTCHLKKSEDGETGRTTHAPALQGQVGDEIPQYFDLAVLLRGTVMSRVVGDETKRVQVKLMQTYPDLNYPWIKDRSGKLPSELELDFDHDFKVIYSSIFTGQEVGDSAAVSELAERQQKVEEDLAPSQTGAPPEPPAKAAASAKKAAPAKAAPAKKAAAPAKAAAKKVAAPAKAADAKADAKEEEKAPEAPEAAQEPEEEPQAPEATDGGEAPEEPQEGEQETPEAEPEAEPEPDGGTPEGGEETEETQGDGEAEAEEPAEEPEPDRIFCESCGGEVDSEDQADLSRIRFRKVLCRPCFKDAKADNKK